jgi:hypothetical protein
MLHGLDIDANEIKTVVSKVGQRGCSCSNGIGTRCPTLEFNSNSEFATVEEAIDYLASILVEIFMAVDFDD